MCPLGGNGSLVPLNARSLLQKSSFLSRALLCCKQDWMAYRKKYIGPLSGKRSYLWQGSFVPNGLPENRDMWPLFDSRLSYRQTTHCSFVPNGIPQKRDMEPILTADDVTDAHNTLQHHCNTTATHCNTVQQNDLEMLKERLESVRTQGSLMQHPATHCNRLHHTTTHVRLKD